MAELTRRRAIEGVGNESDVQPIVSVRGLVKRFTRESGAVTAAVDNVSLDVHAGEFVVLLGPSGCGKTTLLRMLAGLEVPDEGFISIRGRTVFDGERKLRVPTERRSISMIFQSYALWPHMTVAQNIAYPLQRPGSKKRSAEVRQEVARVLELVRIPDLGGQYPGQMSGGQQQRVALARALVSGSDLVLFDEPLSNVDAQVREQLRYELLEMQRELGFAAVYVTHDQEEAMGLANRLAVMREGSIAQIASPREAYENPVSRYVASFIGASNEVEGVLEQVDEQGHGIVRTDFGAFQGLVSDPQLAVGSDATLVWRPEHASITAERPASPNGCWGTVETVLFAGGHMEVLVRCQGSRMRIWSHATVQIEEGSSVWIQTDERYNRILGG